jgi:hypothetical protein
MKYSSDWCFIKSAPDWTGNRHRIRLLPEQLKPYPVLVPMRTTTDEDDIKDDVRCLLADFVAGDGEYNVEFQEQYRGVSANPKQAKALREYAKICENIFINKTGSGKCPVQWMDVDHEMPAVEHPGGKFFLGHSFYRHARVKVSCDGEDDTIEDTDNIDTWKIIEDDCDDVPIIAFASCNPESLYGIPLGIMLAYTWDVRKTADPDGRIVMASDMLSANAAILIAEEAITYISGEVPKSIFNNLVKRYTRYYADTFGSGRAETFGRMMNMFRRGGLRDAIKYCRERPDQFYEELTQNVGNQ